MPQSIAIAGFILGAVLLLIAILGGQFKLFGAEVSGIAGKTARIIAGLMSVIFIVGGIILKSSESPAQKKSSTKAGLTVMVTPSSIEMERNGASTVTWTLAETNSVGINITDRTGEWRTSGDRVIKSVGPIQTKLRIDPFGRKDWTNDIVLYEDAANGATDGILVLEEGFTGTDDNGNSVTGKARVRVTIRE